MGQPDEPARRGPGHLPDDAYCGVVNRFFAAAIAGEPLLVNGDGGRTRDFTYVDDAVDATLLAAVNPPAQGEVFNVGTAARSPSHELAAAIGQAVGSAVEILHLDGRDIDNIRRPVVNIE